MQKKEGKEIQGKAGIFRVTKFSRRQFLKSTGIVAAGAALGSISLASACKSSSSTTTGTTTGVNPTTGGPTTSNDPASSSTTPSSNLPTSSLPAGYFYIPPTGLPPLITVTGHSCTVANDGRVYSFDHVWVKSLSANIAVMGITATMVELLSQPYRCALSQVGSTLANGDSFGTIEGYKLTADLISPVSGTLIQSNPLVIGFVGQDGQIQLLAGYPYTGGWMVVVQLSNPGELKTLMTAQSYMTLVAANAKG